MTERKLSFLLVLFSLIGGIIGFVVGEFLIQLLQDELHPILLIAIYFGQFALFVGVFCLLAEIISPDLNGSSWRAQYVGQGWKWLLPSTLIMLFIAGSLFQFIYGLNILDNQPPKNIVIVLDVSGSMNETDPYKGSIHATKDLIRKLDDEKKIAILTFNHEVNVVQPLDQLANDQLKEQIIAKLDQEIIYDGGTDIGLALNGAKDQIGQESDSSRNSMVILLSDGYSEFDMASTLEFYKKNNIAVNTIGVSYTGDDGARELRNIASQTNGNYYDVSDTSNLTMVFDQIYSEEYESHLVGPRIGLFTDSMLYAFLRVLFIALIGALLGLSLGIIFDNRYLATSFLFGGLLAGLIAGLVLEIGFRQASFPDWGNRLVADIILATVVALSTIVIPYKQNQGQSHRSKFYAPSKGSKGFDESTKRSSTGFK